MEEIWKAIPGYDGKYEASNLGNIRSLNYKNQHCIGLLKPRLRRGYLTVTLNHKVKLVYRLVAMTFLPNPNNFPEVNHIDENKLNCQASNLEWSTKSHNINHGTRNKRVAEKEKLSKPGKPVLCIETNIIYSSYREAQRQTGIKHIWEVCTKRAKTAGSYHWRYRDEIIR